MRRELVRHTKKGERATRGRAPTSSNAAVSSRPGLAAGETTPSTRGPSWAPRPNRRARRRRIRRRPRTARHAAPGEPRSRRCDRARFARSSRRGRRATLERARTSGRGTWLEPRGESFKQSCGRLRLRSRQGFVFGSSADKLREMRRLATASRAPALGARSWTTLDERRRVKVRRGGRGVRADGDRRGRRCCG